MFGPKNAPGKQRQFLYIPTERDAVHIGNDYVNNISNSSNDSKTYTSLSDLKPMRCAICTMTQFDGIPMADVFKVLQYWIFQNNGNNITIHIGMCIT